MYIARLNSRPKMFNRTDKRHFIFRGLCYRVMLFRYTELYPGITRSLDVDWGRSFATRIFQILNPRVLWYQIYAWHSSLEKWRKKKGAAETKLETRKQKTRENEADKKIFYAFVCTHNAINPITRIFVIRRLFRP